MAFDYTKTAGAASARRGPGKRAEHQRLLEGSSITPTLWPSYRARPPFAERATVLRRRPAALRCQAGQAFKHVDGFDARSASGSYYHHAAHLPAGRYCLFLLDESGSRGGVEVKAHRNELK